MTAQITETLVYNGQTLSMCTEPLQGYLAQGNCALEFERTSTACWRGYTGTWAVRDKRLYLTQLAGRLKGGAPVNLETLFANYPQGVFAHWFSGQVRCTKGKLLKYVHMGYASQFEEDIFLQFSQGVLVAERTVRNGTAPDSENRSGNVIAAMTVLNKACHA